MTGFYYLLLLLIVFICSPLLIWQGRQIRRRVPKLPEADRNRSGQIGEDGAPTRLVLLGESHIAGVGLTDHNEAIAGRLAYHLGNDEGSPFSWQVSAKSGATLEEVIADQAPQLSKLEADLILVGTGANDAFRLRSPWAFRRQMRKLLEEIEQLHPGVPVLVANLPPVGQFPALPTIVKWVMRLEVFILSETTRMVTSRFERVFFPGNRISFLGWRKKYQQVGALQDLFSDGIHPSALTHDLWAKELSSFLLEEKILE